MIMVIIILAVVVFGNSTKPIDTAGQVKFLQELAVVKSSVYGKRMANAKLGTDERTINTGFIKVAIANPPDGYVSFDTDDITGYVVDLTTIEYDKLVRGRGYMDIERDDVVTFGVDDVYVYDAAGNVYYVKGFETDSDEEGVIYADSSSSRKEGPTVEIESVVNGRVTLIVTPRYEGTISSVIVGGKLATSTDGRLFTVALSENGTYTVIATEEGGGTTRTTISITDSSGTMYEIPQITLVRINDGSETSKQTLAKITVEAQHVAFINVSVNTSAKPNVNDGTKWRKYGDQIELSLNEGKNEVYVWGKNSGDAISEYRKAEVYIDSKAPSKEAPSYTLTHYTVTLTANQKDTSEITVIYGMMAPGDTDYTWQLSRVFDGLEAGKEYTFVTKATDILENESISNTTKVTIPAIPNGVMIAVSPDGWSMKKEVTIQYPNTYGVGYYQNMYRLNGGDWQVVNRNTFTMEMITNATIEAVVSENYPGTDHQLGTIAKETITTIDRLPPEITRAIPQSENAYEQETCDIVFDAKDEESGIVAWTVTNANVEPNRYENSVPASREMKNMTYQVTENGTYYVWVKDVAGQVTSQSVEVTNIDPKAPVIKEIHLDDTQVGKIIMHATVQDEKLGFSAYAVVKGENVTPGDASFINITPTKEEVEVVSQDITENDTYTLWVKDISGRTAKSSVYVRPKLTVTYDIRTNGGESGTNIDTKQVGINMPVDLTPTAQKTIGRFIGWNTNKDATEGLSTLTAGKSEDITLYAIFENSVQVTLVYYDGTEKVTEDLSPRKVYSGAETVYVTLPEITTTYPGWTMLGFTTSTDNTAEAEYSGDEMVVASKTNVTLYAVYRKDIRGTFRYYTSKIEDKAVENANYVFTESVSDTSYRGYYSTIDIEQEEIRTNAFDFAHTTNAKFTVPEVPSEVKYGSTENIWTLRGWSESQISNAEVTHHNSDAIYASDHFDLYASYETTVKANKYVYGSNEPVVATGAATLSYLAEVRSAEIALGSADPISYGGDTFVPRGWSKEQNADALVNVENNGTARIFVDTNYYASYDRDITLSIYTYSSTLSEEEEKAYINYQGEVIPATFTMPDTTLVEVEDSTWLARGYSKETNPDAVIALDSGAKVSTMTDVTYYVSYHKNFQVTKRTLASTEEMNATAFMGYDGTLVGAKVNLGSISGSVYQGLTWRGAYFSTSTSGVPTKDALMGVETEVTGDTTFYAIYERDVMVKKHIYKNREETAVGVAYLNANGTITDAVINLGSTENVSQDGITWTFVKWSNKEDLADDTASYTLPNGDFETPNDANVYALYGNNSVSVKAYYLNEEGTPTENNVGSSAFLSYSGATKSETTVTIPAISSVTKDGKTWTPLGYLWSKDGYTIEDYDGVIAVPKEGKVVSIEADEKYFAIYETEITIQKVEYENSVVQRNQKVRMNASANKQSVAVELGSAKDIVVNNKLWTASGWMKEDDSYSSASPDFANDVTDYVSEDTTYLATYQRDFHVEIEEYAENTTPSSRLETVPGYLDARGNKLSSAYTLPDVMIAKISASTVMWDFDGWTIEKAAGSETYGYPGEIKQITDDMILYAKYSRNASVTEYTYPAQRGETKTGKAAINVNGDIQKAEITLSEISPVSVDGQTYTARGWSTNKGATDGENFILSGGVAEVFADLIFYASYQDEIVVNFISYNGTAQVTKTRRTVGYMNYVGNTNNSSCVVVPEAEAFGTWTADGYTESHMANVEATAKIFGLYPTSSSQDLYALYQRNITLTYDANGGTMTPIIETYSQRVNTYDVSSVTPIQIIVTDEEPIRNDVEFAKKWRDGNTGREYAAGDTITIERSTTLYAVWEIDTTVTSITFVYGDESFKGNRFVDTGIRLFDEANFHRNFEITAGVSNFVYTAGYADNRNYFLSATDESRGPYPGIQMIYLGGTTNQFQLKVNKTRSAEITRSLGSTISEINLRRQDDILYHAGTEITTLSDVVRYFNDTLLLGAQKNASGAMNRPTKIDLSDIRIKLEYEKAELNDLSNILPTPQKEGNTFEGWYTRATGGHRVRTSGDLSAGNNVLYAHWTGGEIPDWAVAECKGEFFSTLQAAIDYVDTNNEPETVTLLKNISEHVTVANGQNIELDLDGNTIRNDNNSTTVANNGTLSILNGKISATNSTSYAVYNNGVLDMREVEVYSNVTTWYYFSAPVYNNGEMSITGGKVISDMTVNGSYVPYAIYVGNDKVLHIYDDLEIISNYGRGIGTHYAGASFQLYIGRKDGKVSNSYPLIQAAKEPIYRVEDRMSFYDGIIKTASLSPSLTYGSNIADIEQEYGIKYDTEEDAEGTVYQTAYLAPSGEMIAEVNGRYYSLLQEAINQVPADNTKTTVRLLNNTEECLTVAANQNIMLNLGKNTVTGTSAANTLNNQGTLEILNGTIQIADESISRTVIYNYGNGNVTINDGTTVKSMGTGSTIYFTANGKLDIKGGNIFSAKNNAISQNSDNAKLEISGTSLISGESTGYATIKIDRGTATITDGTIVSEKYIAVNANSNYGNNMTISGGVTIISRATNQPAVNVGGDKNTFTLGTSGDGVNTQAPLIQGNQYGLTIGAGITCNIYDGIIRGVTRAINGESNITEIESGDYAIRHIFEINEDTGTIYQTAYLAPTSQTGAWYNGTRYTTLQEAIDQVPTGNEQSTITLKESFIENVTIPQGKNIYMAMQGNTIKNNTQEDTIKNNGALTLQNGTVVIASTSAKTGIANYSTGTLKVDGTNIYASQKADSTIYNNGGSVEICGNSYLESSSTLSNKNYSLDNNNGTLVITSGTIISKQNVGLNIVNGTVTLGTYDGTGIPNNNPIIQGATYGITSTKDFYFYDGTIKGVDGAVDDATKIAYKEDGCIVSDGTEYDAETDITYQTAKLVLAPNAITITFEPNAEGATVSKRTKLAVPGEKIGTLPTAENGLNAFKGWYERSTGGNQITENTLASASVTSYYAQWDMAVAKIGNTGYKTINDAINAATPGVQTTITVLQDTSEAIAVVEGKNIILELQECIITNNGSKNVINSSGDLIVRGGTLRTTVSQGAINSNKGGTMIIDGVRIEATTKSSRQAIYNNGGTLTIQGDSYFSSASSSRPTLNNLNNGIMYIKSGTIISEAQQALKIDNGTVYIGDKDDGELKMTPEIQGYTYAITVASSVKFKFYDGILKAGNNGAAAVDRDANAEIESGYHKEYGTEAIGTKTYKTEWLEVD